MGAGLALTGRWGWRRWSTTWRLLGIAMPLCIVALTLLGLWGLGWSSAPRCSGAALAPTDPVLAADVQVGEPADEEDEADRKTRSASASPPRPASTTGWPSRLSTWPSPSAVGASPSEWFADWFTVDVLWRFAVGVLLGFG